jgi:hypothetical protein
VDPFVLVSITLPSQAVSPFLAKLHLSTVGCELGLLYTSKWLATG